MRFLRQRNNMTEFQEVFEIAARMPYDWNRIVGKLLGDTHSNLTFGGSCGDQALFTIMNLPDGYAQLTCDEANGHFGVLVEGRHHFDPVFYQTGINPYSTGDNGNTNVYPSLIRGGSLAVTNDKGKFDVNIEYPRGRLLMSVVNEDTYELMDSIREQYRSQIGRKPYILFPSIDGCEVKVGYDAESQGLYVNTRYARGVADRSVDQRLTEMEQTYGFSSEDLLRYFAESWRRVTRMVNVD